MTSKAAPSEFKEEFRERATQWALDRAGLVMDVAGLDAIRSISQQTLARNWRRAACHHRIPTLQKFELTDRQHDRNQLIFWRVEGTAPSFRFRSLFQGENVTEVLGEVWSELTVTSAGSFQTFAYASLCDVVDGKTPVYSILSTIDADGFSVECERLLLPFGSADKVNVVLSSLQLISQFGNFNRRSVMQLFLERCDVNYTASIIFDLGVAYRRGTYRARRRS